jgi:hypothetical protein
MVHTSMTTQTDLDTPTCWVSYWHAHIFHVRKLIGIVLFMKVSSAFILTFTQPFHNTHQPKMKHAYIYIYEMQY